MLCITGDLTPEDCLSQASMSAALPVMGGTDGKDWREREARVFLSLYAWGGAGRGCLPSVALAPIGLARPPVRGGVGFLLVWISRYTTASLSSQSPSLVYV